jgi:HlyD family secretion protein
VIERTVEPGQTVAASFATPKLFIIAEDLAEMEILANVDESDIGLVGPGQSVEFTVAAYPGRTFSGVVRERQLQPQTIQNVVHYTIVVTADNESGLLLPGMTATLDFIVDELREALLVPASAFLFDPPDAIREAARKKQREASEDKNPGEISHDGGTAFSSDVAELWVPDGKLALRPMLVRVLSSDGASTAIAALPSVPASIEPGLEVVTRVNEKAKSNNPFRRR